MACRHVAIASIVTLAIIGFIVYAASSHAFIRIAALRSMGYITPYDIRRDGYIDMGIRVLRVSGDDAIVRWRIRVAEEREWLFVTGHYDEMASLRHVRIRR